MSDSYLSQEIVSKLIAFGVAPLIDVLDCQIYNHSEVEPQQSGTPADRDNHSDEESEQCIGLFWHEHILLASPALVMPNRATALCSQHRDGELVSQTAQTLGMNVVRGSTSRGGTAAIRELQRNADGSSILITPDGPRGPRRQMSLGAIFLAAKLGLPIVTVGVGVTSPIRLNTWDRFTIPKPWSRVRVVVGPKVYPPSQAKKRQLENYRSGCERLLNDMCDQAQQWADSGEDLPGQRRYRRFRRQQHLSFQLPGQRRPIKPLGRANLL